MDLPYSSSIDAHYPAKNRLQFSFQGEKQAPHKENTVSQSKTEEYKDNKHPDLQNSTRMKLKDYMKLSCIMKRSRSKNGTQSPKKVAQSHNFSEANTLNNISTEHSDGKRSSIYREKDSPKKKTLNLGYVEESTATIILKQEISNQILKLQKKLQYLSHNLQKPFNEQYDPMNEITDLCQIQRIIQDRLCPGVEQANKLLNKSRYHDKFQGFMNQATNHLSEYPKQKSHSKNSLEKMSPLKRIKYLKEKGQYEKSLMQLNSLCIQSKSKKTLKAPKKGDDQFYS